MNANTIKLLLIEDDPAYANLIGTMLTRTEESKFEIENTPRLATGLELLAEQQYQVCLLDLSLPDSQGLDTFLETYAAAPSLPIIVLTGLEDEELAVEAVRRGAQDYIAKSEADTKLLNRTVRYAIERKRTEETLKSQNRSLAILNRVSQTLSSTLDFDLVLTQVLSDVTAMLNAEAASVLLYDETSEELIFVASVGPGSGDLVGTRMPATVGIAGWAMREAQPILVNDAQQDSRFYNRIDTDTGITTRSLLAMPLRYKDKVIGVIEAINRTDRPFNDQDVESMSTLSISAAIAIENARLYEAEREQRILVERSHTQLVQSEKLAATGRLAASLAHEINNPLQAIHTSLQLMLTFPVEPDEQQEYIAMADEEVQRLINIVTRILDFARPSQAEREPIHLDKAIERTLNLANKFLQHKRIVVECDYAPKLPPVTAIPGELQQVFLNLVINAVDAMPAGGTLRISTSLAEDGRQTVSLSDTGEGIPAEHLDHIFEPFYSTKDSGTGLGLSVSHNVIARHGGEITVHSAPGEGTTFTVWLPASS